MRISDWSSDVCSSDLRTAARAMNASPAMTGALPVVRIEALDKTYHPGEPGEVRALRDVSLRINAGEFVAIMGPRSEAHTSEPQSLMRTSYAVFCSKKTQRQPK